MKRIEVRGMLVGAEYDDPFMHREIENGIFTPSSKVIREIDEANGDDIEIFVDSEGGDVFSYHSTLDKILNYPGNITFMIGATAFSEAANFILLSKRPVKCYPFSMMLFHSAMSTVYDGASGELKAEAEILDRINAPVKAALIQHGIPEEEVERGFQDRNALVLGADDLVKYGIATLLEEEAPEQPKIDEAISMRLAALAEANQRIAAHFHSIKTVNKSEMKSEEITKELEEALGFKPASDASEEEKKETPCAEETEETKKEEETPVEEETKEETPSEETKEEETPSEGTEEEKKEEETPTSEEEEDPLLKTLETLKENMDSLSNRMSALEEKLTEKEVELQDAKKALKAERSKRIGAMAAAVSGKTESSGPSDWPAAVKACKGDKLEAYKQYPELAKAWTKTN